MGQSRAEQGWTSRSELCGVRGKSTGRSARAGSGDSQEEVGGEVVEHSLGHGVWVCSEGAGRRCSCGMT